MQLIVGIATSGRRELLPQVIAYFAHQTRLPDAIYVCPAKDIDYDVAENAGFPCPIHVVRGGVGLPAQRNVILASANEADLIVFFDDDFLADRAFLQELEALFVDRPSVVMATGDVIADGANTPGISFEEARTLIEALPPLPAEVTKPVFNAYGCNMALRASTAREHDIKFDEVLPLYGWWEDVDFSRRMAPFGDILEANRLRGVHMGSKSGRTPGQRLGYSQVANVAYMVQKGTIPLNVGVVRIGRNVIANLVRQFKPESWVDRRGRFIGNMKALVDCCKAPANPRRILDL